MKKMFIAIGVLAFFFLASSIAVAQTADDEETASEQADGFLTVTMDVENVDGTSTDFTYDPSPNVGLTIYASSSAFSITTANSLVGADKNNGSEYGTLSTSTGYALRDKTTNTTVGPEAADDVSALPGSDWAWQGGSGS